MLFQINISYQERSRKVSSQKRKKCFKFHLTLRKLIDTVHKNFFFLPSYLLLNGKLIVYINESYYFQHNIFSLLLHTWYYYIMKLKIDVMQQNLFFSMNNFLSFQSRNPHGFAISGIIFCARKFQFYVLSLDEEKICYCCLIFYSFLFFS